MTEVWIEDAETHVHIQVRHLEGVPRVGDQIHVAGEDCDITDSRVRWDNDGIAVVVAEVSPRGTLDKEWWK